MNAIKRDTIEKMRADGMNYSSIAKVLDMKEVTVKKHCQRNQIYVQD